MDSGSEADDRRGVIKAPQDFAGGVALIALAAFALWQGADLPLGTIGGMGPGMLPRALSVLLAALGLVLLTGSFLHDGDRLERWPLRGILFVMLAIVAFGLTIRPLGLAVAGPLAVILSGLASSDTRWVETIVFGLTMTAFCLGLFRFALSLPIPVAPWLINY